ncbi:MAG TPA: hypothetical protein VN207_10050 [Ktedonobacteraceae bacterium]|nr:hypothetical protein [Ktedonobacteraceae bacterium]
MAHNNPRTWERVFSFQGKKLFYNRIPYNHISERCVEIPIAFDFLAHLENKSKILEIGNVLSLYENSLSDFVGIRDRRIVDKFEVALGVDNVDLMDLPSEEKYPSIVCISTVEHIGQSVEPTGNYGEQNEVHDLEAPLKAIAKIYDILSVEGKALITVPFGKLTDSNWFVLFSIEYLRLLETKFGVPKEALSLSFLQRVDMQPNEVNPYQIWVESKEEDLVEVEYGPYGGANAICIVELIKLSDTFILDINVPATPLVYEKPREEQRQWRILCTPNEVWDCLS